MIKKSMPNEDMPDFDDMMKEAEQEIESHDAENKLDTRLVALMKINEQVEKTTNNLINAMLQLEHAFQIYRLFETNAKATVDGIYQKVDTINSHVDGVVQELPGKLQLKIHVTDGDKQWFLDRLGEHQVEVVDKHFADLKEIDDKFAAQERKTQKRFKEYGGCYLGYYAQWIYFTFFFIGIMASAMVIVVFIAYHYGLL